MPRRPPASCPTNPTRLFQRREQSVLVTALALVGSRERQTRTQQWVFDMRRPFGQPQVRDAHRVVAGSAWRFLRRRLLIAEEEAMGRDVQEARRFDLFERRLGRLASHQHRCLRHDGLDRQRLVLRARQRPERDRRRIDRVLIASLRVFSTLSSSRGDSRYFAEDRIGNHQRRVLAQLRSL
jgi:hypothetical protein